VLGLEPGASADALEEAFRRRAWDAHPDRGGNVEDFAALVEARRVLERLVRARGDRRTPPGERPAAAVSVEPDGELSRRMARQKVRRWMGRRSERHLH
jgi:hypothetical protein